jgi:hypothetical protein
MKKPLRKPATDVPEGTVWFGGPLEWFSVALVIHTETIPVDRLSQLLECEPTRVRVKGVAPVRADGSAAWPLRSTSWTLAMLREETDEWDLCEAAKLVLGRVNASRQVWEEISGQAQVVLSFGLSMDGANRGFSLDAELLRYLSERGIRADFDVYTDDFEGELEQGRSAAKPSAH